MKIDDPIQCKMSRQSREVADDLLDSAGPGRLKLYSGHL